MNTYEVESIDSDNFPSKGSNLIEEFSISLNCRHALKTRERNDSNVSHTYVIDRCPFAMILYFMRSKKSVDHKQENEWAATSPINVSRNEISLPNFPKFASITF